VRTPAVAAPNTPVSLTSCDLPFSYGQYWRVCTAATASVVPSTANVNAAFSCVTVPPVVVISSNTSGCLS